jgi:hypothetical protein
MNKKRTCSNIKKKERVMGLCRRMNLFKEHCRHVWNYHKSTPHIFNKIKFKENSFAKSEKKWLNSDCKS